MVCVVADARLDGQIESMDFSDGELFKQTVQDSDYPLHLQLEPGYVQTQLTQRNFYKLSSYLEFESPQPSAWRASTVCRFFSTTNFFVNLCRLRIMISSLEFIRR